MTNSRWLYLQLPKLRIRSRRGSLVRTSREVSDRTLLRVVLTEPGTYLIEGVSAVDVKVNLTPTQLLLDGGQRCHAPSGITLTA